MTEKALLELTASIVAATVENNRISTDDVAGLIVLVHDALAKLGTPPTMVETIADKVKPAVSVRSSIKPDSLTCLECGRVQKALKRHWEHRTASPQPIIGQNGRFQRTTR